MMKPRFKVGDHVRVHREWDEYGHAGIVIDVIPTDNSGRSSPMGPAGYIADYTVRFKCYYGDISPNYWGDYLDFDILKEEPLSSTEYEDAIAAIEAMEKVSE